MIKKGAFLLLLFGILSLTAWGRDFSISSPDGRLRVVIRVAETVTYSLMHDGVELVCESPLSMTLNTGEIWGHKAQVRDFRTEEHRGTIASPFSKSAMVTDHYREGVLRFRGDWALRFRLYNDGMAYRFVSHKKELYEVASEEVCFRFPADYDAYLPYVRGDDPWQGSFENIYSRAPLSETDSLRQAFLPVLVDAGGDRKICVTEADLESYPGMYLRKGASGSSLQGVFAPYPTRTEQGGYNMLQQRVKERAPYIARVQGPRAFPWRVVQVTTADKDLAVSDLTYRLAAPSRVQDIDWIRPGKVAWEWWHNWNITGVDFCAGINNDTYQYYIDFAAEHGIEYVILDEGWSVNKVADLMQVVPEIDLKKLVAYADAKRVGIILWAGYWAFDRDMEAVCRHYAAMGIKGFKVDFMDRDDQQMVDFIYRAAETAARYHLVLDLHGMYKPAGLQRTFPHILNFEGVYGLEQVKWADESVDMVTYDVTVPFIRMVSGPMDYTQGAMRNAARGNFRSIHSEPMSQGTRCHQLALYVVFESPLNMLCDSPSEYRKESESLAFIAGIPTVWDESVALDGEVGRYIAIARRSGDKWYVGGLTNWDAREMEVDFSFLPAGTYRATIFQDGSNADRKGTDYARKECLVTPSDHLLLHLSRGGGFAMELDKLR